MLWFLHEVLTTDAETNVRNMATDLQDTALLELGLGLEKTVQSNHSALEKRDCHTTFQFPPALQAVFCNALTCPVKKRVDLAEVSISYKSEKTSGQTVQPIKIKTVALF